MAQERAGPRVATGDGGWLTVEHGGSGCLHSPTACSWAGNAKRLQAPSRDGKARGMGGAPPELTLGAERGQNKPWSAALRLASHFVTHLIKSSLKITCNP